MKKLRVVLILCIIPLGLFAHTLIMNLEDNEDGTIRIEGIFNTGQTASGAMIRLESLVDGKILFKKRLPSESEIIVSIPDEPYQIVLDGGPGHTIVKEGIEPQEGYKKEANKNITVTKEETKIQNSFDTLPYYTASILFILTIFVSVKNTNKLMREFKSRFK